MHPIATGLIAGLAVATLLSQPLESFAWWGPPDTRRNWLSLWPLLSAVASVAALAGAYAFSSRGLMATCILAALLHMSHFYYAMGTGYSNGWTLTNPQMDGYSGVISYFPPKKATVVVFATFRPGGDATVQYAGMVFNQMAAIIAPDNPPNISTCPRGDC